MKVYVDIKNEKIIKTDDEDRSIYLGDENADAVKVYCNALPTYWWLSLSCKMPNGREIPPRPHDGVAERIEAEDGTIWYMFTFTLSKSNGWIIVEGKNEFTLRINHTNTSNVVVRDKALGKFVINVNEAVEVDDDILIVGDNAGEVIYQMKAAISAVASQIANDNNIKTVNQLIARLKLEVTNLLNAENGVITMTPAPGQTAYKVVFGHSYKEDDAANRKYFLMAVVNKEEPTDIIFAIDTRGACYYKNFDILNLVDKADLQTQIDSLENSKFNKTGGALTGSITLGGTNKGNNKGLFGGVYNSAFGFNDEGLPTIINGKGERVIAIGIDELDGIFNHYTFPAKDGNIMLEADIRQQIDNKIESNNRLVNDTINAVNNDLQAQIDVINLKGDFTNYYTKNETYSSMEIDDKLANINVDLTDYSTTTEVKNIINESVENKSIQDREYFESKIANIDLSSYPTKNETDSLISSAIENKSREDKNYTDTRVNEVKDTVTTLIGNAPESYDTLVEIAEYIESDQSGASQMLAGINKNTADIETIKTNVNSISTALDTKADANNVSSLIAGIQANLNNSLTTKANKDDVYIKTETHNKDEIHQMLLTRVPTTDFDTYKEEVSSNFGGITTQIADIYNVKASVSYVDAEVDGLLKDANSYAFSQANLAYNNASSYTDSAVSVKANIADVYTKTEIDKKETSLNTSIDNALIEAKAYADQIGAGGEANLEGYVKTTAFNDAINVLESGKANINDVYTKTDADTLLNTKVNNQNGKISGSLIIEGETYSLKIEADATDSQGYGGGIRLTAKPSLINSAYNKTDSLLIRAADGGIQIGEDYDLGYYGIIPLKDSHKDLGSPSLKFKNLYLSGKLKDGTNEITIADIASRYTNAQIDDKINLLLDDEGATATLDSFKEIRDYLEANQDSATLVESVQKNANDIADIKTDVANRYDNNQIDTKLGTKQNSLTTAQINAVNSGITSTKVSSYDSAVSDVATLKTTVSNKADKTEIPTKVSQLNNDSGYITSAALSPYQTTTDAEDDFDYTNGRIDTLTTNIATNTSNISKLQTTVAGKQDSLGYTPLNKAGDTIEGDLTTKLIQETQYTTGLKYETSKFDFSYATSLVAYPRIIAPGRRLLVASSETDLTTLYQYTFPLENGTILTTGGTSFTRNLTSGTKIGAITINGTSTNIYAPNPTRYLHRICVIGMLGDDSVLINFEIIKSTVTAISQTTLNSNLISEKAISITSMKKATGTYGTKGSVIGIASSGTATADFSQITLYTWNAETGYKAIALNSITVQSFVDNVVTK